MKLTEALLAEFDQEVAHTRKTLERVPNDKLGWKPHEKSMTMGQLATHLAELAGWAQVTLAQDSFDMAPPGAPPYESPKLGSAKEIVAMFDRNAAAARAALAGLSEAALERPWSLLQGGKTLMTLPRAAVLRSFVLNHTVHHRAQLGVYLRLNNLPVPSIYGPSADEGGPFQP